jgi:cytochrome c-type biogenesis protein CcmH/NrfF
MNTTIALQLVIVNAEASWHFERQLEHRQSLKKSVSLTNLKSYKEHASSQQNAERIMTFNNESWRHVADKLHFRIVDPKKRYKSLGSKLTCNQCDP